MERLLLFCGVWIIIVPILFQNSYFEEQKNIHYLCKLLDFLHF